MRRGGEEKVGKGGGKREGESARGRECSHKMQIGVHNTLLHDLQCTVRDSKMCVLAVHVVFYSCPSSSPHFSGDFLKSRLAWH